MGFVLSYFGSVMGLLIVLWGLNGVLQSVGGPASYSTILDGRQERNVASLDSGIRHNIGGAIAGGVALWGANVFFHWKCYRDVHFPSVMPTLLIATFYRKR